MGRTHSFSPGSLMVWEHTTRREDGLLHRIPPPEVSVTSYNALKVEQPTPVDPPSVQGFLSPRSVLSVIHTRTVPTTQASARLFLHLGSSKVSTL